MPVLADPAPAPPRMPPASPEPNQQHLFHHGISLLHGWLPTTIELLAAAVLVIAVARRTRRWWLIQLPVCVAVGGAAALAAEWYVADEGLASDNRGRRGAPPRAATPGSSRRPRSPRPYRGSPVASACLPDPAELGNSLAAVAVLAPTPAGCADTQLATTAAPVRNVRR
ncbi:hypothetical protein [Nocardia pneumoniae]|uniref:hypothetical protein n=1 Tax=Nocardia pneumoniae TaxID=228601 RepID=UPI0012F66DD7|nr:hypothetical protein [Nocardia pneumoniae]